jgi:hypothetical protein
LNILTTYCTIKQAFNALLGYNSNQIMKKQLILFAIFCMATIAQASVKLPGNNNLPYNNFNASKFGLKKDIFDKAIKGYENLIAKGQVKNKRYITICDMTMSSKKKRFFVLDVETKKVVYCMRVTHGSGSGEEFATKFSNIVDSHQTSLGFYTTGGEYIGENGISLKLNGEESGFNDNAFERAVVIHGSEYATEEYFKNNNKIGRSWGCPAVSSKEIAKVIKLIKNGSCLFIYHNDKTYNKKSKLIK